MRKCPVCGITVSHLKKHMKKEHLTEFKANLKQKEVIQDLSVEPIQNSDSLIDITNGIQAGNSQEIYHLIKDYYDQAMIDINFKCLECGECCFFTDLEKNGQEACLYGEDLQLLVDGNIDMKGCICTMKAFDKRDGSYILDAKLDELKKNALNFFGYEKFLRLFSIQNRNYCYYFDIGEKKCKIHDNKPLVCYTYPYNIENKLERIGVAVQPECNFVKQQIKMYGSLEKYIRYLESIPSFKAYKITSLLYLKSKNRVVIRNGEFLPKTEGYGELMKKIYQETQKLFDNKE